MRKPRKIGVFGPEYKWKARGKMASTCPHCSVDFKAFNHHAIGGPECRARAHIRDEPNLSLVQRKVGVQVRRVRKDLVTFYGRFAVVPRWILAATANIPLRRHAYIIGRIIENNQQTAVETAFLMGGPLTVLAITLPILAEVDQLSADNLKNGLYVLQKAHEKKGI